MERFERSIGLNHYCMETVLLTELYRPTIRRLLILPLSIVITFSSLQEVCHQYWPDDSTKGVQKYGEYSVSVLRVTEQDGYIERFISITNPKVIP